jgi:hypothetical protein
MNLAILLALLISCIQCFIGLSDLNDNSKFPYYPPTKRIYYGDIKEAQFGDLYIPNATLNKPSNGFKIVILLHGTHSRWE